MIAVAFCHPIGMVLLAQAVAASADASAANIGMWILSGTAVLSAVASGIAVFKRKPPIESEFATKAEVVRMEESLKGELQRLDEKIDTHFIELNTTGERRAAVTHDRINEVLQSVSRLEGRLHQ